MQVALDKSVCQMHKSKCKCVKPQLTFGSNKHKRCNNSV